MTSMRIVPVLLAGGIGERFWPMSRSSMPKQLLKLISDRTMLEETLARIKPACGAGVKPVIATGRNIAGIIKKTLPKSLAYDMLIEPMGKDSAPPVALAAAYVQKKYGDCIMVVLSADHAITPHKGFIDAVKHAADIAWTQDKLMVFGITPSRPDTGYGYIEQGRELDGGRGVRAFTVRRFVEKPDAATAKKLVKSGKYYWNGGMFVWKTSVILAEFAAHMPQLHAHLEIATKAGFTQKAVDRYFENVEKKSLDYGVMEHSTRVAAVCGSFTWDDIGSWESMRRIHPLNALATVAVGKSVVTDDSSGCVVFNASSKGVAAVGCEDLAVVVTDDAVLVIPREKLPKIKEYMSAMKKSGALDAGLF